MSELPQVLRKYESGPIAVYGLGVETEKILPDLEGKFQVIGLLDGYRESGEIYGKEIISMGQAVNKAVKLILVVARPGSCRAIAKRIGGLCAEHEIALFDIRGRDLCSPHKTAYDFRDVSGITKNQLLRMVMDKGAVSFDLFDTLVMRQVLFPEDVFDIVNHKLRKQGIFIENFSGKRMECEKKLSRMAAPTLTEIYACMVDTYSVKDISPQSLAALEWETDYGCLVPRRDMCELVNRISEVGKEIYVVSDTYYRREQIERILEKCNISCRGDILASCEYGTGKQQGLFEKLIDKVQGKTCIHIGDDETTDVESARKNGVPACRIHSGQELLGIVGYFGLWDAIGSLSSRIRIGMLTAELFNSPFQFEDLDKKVNVKGAYEIGYLFFAPIISDFVLWFRSQMDRITPGSIWFGARDGYLIKKLYDELKEDTSSVYFLTSRTAAIRAGMETEEDIRYVGEMKFSGSLKRQMEERFGLEVDNSGIKIELSDYVGPILEKASVNRDYYRKYIKRLNTKDGDIAFFDFVAKGTSQMFLGRLVENHLAGYYFLRLEEEYMEGKQLDITAFYKAGEMEGSAIFDDYYILETVLTSPEPSVKEFDEQGKPCYAQESRSEANIACIQSVQRGIIDYFRTYIRICPEKEREIDKKLDEALLSLIHHVLVSEKEFLNLKVEDPFFNRTTDMGELI